MRFCRELNRRVGFVIPDAQGMWKAGMCLSAFGAGRCILGLLCDGCITVLIYDTDARFTNAYIKYQVRWMSLV